MPVVDFVKVVPPMVMVRLEYQPVMAIPDASRAADDVI